MIFEQEKVTKLYLFKDKTKIKTIDIVMLNNIKNYKGKIQIQQKGNDIYIQTIKENFTIKFNSKLNAIKFLTKITDAVTGTTIAERGTKKVKETIEKIDDTLGIDTKDVVKSVIINGGRWFSFKRS